MNNAKYNIDGSSIELINFINKERQPKRVNYKKVFRFFQRCLTRSIIEMNIKFKNIKGANESVISGINMIYHIFYILITYTNNIKLTIFLLERAILLYTEFIIMSQDKSVVEEIYFVPNINDAIAFSFKKTIGSIIVNDFETNNKHSTFLKESCLVLRNIYKLYFKKPDIFEDTKLFSMDVERNYTTINRLIGDESIENLKNKYYSSNSSLDKTNTETKTNIISLDNFLNIIETEIFENILLFNLNDNYDETLKKIDCIVNGNDNLSCKLGKIKLILFVFTRQYINHDIEINSQILNYLKNNGLDKNNLIYKDVLQRFFDGIVQFNFTEQFTHITSKDCRASSTIENTIIQLKEIFEFIK